MYDAVHNFPGYKCDPEHAGGIHFGIKLSHHQKSKSDLRKRLK